MEQAEKKFKSLKCLWVNKEGRWTRIELRWGRVGMRFKRVSRHREEDNDTGVKIWCVEFLCNEKTGSQVCRGWSFMNVICFTIF